MKKALTAGGYDVDKSNAHVKLAIKRLVTKGTLITTNGTGASGSFKLNNKLAVPKKKPARRPAVKESAAAEKPKEVTAKKLAARKSQKKAGKKPTTPKKASKSPKKA